MQGGLKVAVGILIGVMALLGYLFMGARNETLELQQSLTTKVEQLSATEMKLDSISKVLDAKIREVKKLGGSIAELRNVKGQLENDRKKLKSDLNFSIQKYEVKIKEYERFLVTKDNGIRKLKEENGMLLARAQMLEEEKEKIVKENTGLKTDKYTLFQTVAEYSAENDDLKEQVTLASAMKAVNVQISAMSSSGKVRKGGVYKPSRVDYLRISFIMPSNSLVEKNMKEIYIRILDPNGGVMSEAESGGVITIDGKELGYSLKQNVLFENNDQKVDIFCGKENTYKSGKYVVELYSEGFKIGKSNFLVK